MDLCWQSNVSAFIASDLASITSHIHNWIFFCFGSISSYFLELFLHWSPVAYWAPTNLGSFSFSVLSFCLFTVHGVLKARILNCFAVPFSSGPHFVRTLSYDPSVLGGPTWHCLLFHWVRQGCGPCDQVSRQWQLPSPLSFYFKTGLQEPQS